MSFLDALKKRHSVYAIGKDISLSDDEVINLIKETVKVSPSSMNSQTQRVVILLDEQHEKLWKIVENNLKPLTPEEQFPKTQEKLKTFADGKGTILFFEDFSVVEELQQKFPLYADAMPMFSDHTSAIAQGNTWTALAQEEIGASLQHYNPIIDDDVKAEWDLPEKWKLRAQLVFGSIIEPAQPKPVMPDEERFFVFK